MVEDNNGNIVICYIVIEVEGSVGLDVSFSYSVVVYCVNDVDFLLIIIGEQGGVFSSIVGFSFDVNIGEIDVLNFMLVIYMVIYIVIGINCDGIFNVEVIINVVDDLGFSYSFDYFCVNDNDLMLMVIGFFGGMFFFLSGLSINLFIGEIDVSVFIFGVYIVIYMIVGSCLNLVIDQVEVFSVFIFEFINFGDFCIDVGV